MALSDLFHGRRAVFSPDGKYVSVICGDTINVRFADSLLKAFKFECRNVVKQMGWSGDSLLLFATCGYSSLKIFSVANGSCVGSLKHPTGGISQVAWAPDCRSIIFLEYLLLRVAVWNLLEDEKLLSLKYIQNVQPWAKPCVAFSSNGKHLAIVTTDLMDCSSDCPGKSEECAMKENKGCGDHITIVSAITWRQEKTIYCDGIQRVGGIQWSPDNDAIAVWSSNFPDPVIVLSLHAENIVAKWKPSNNLFWSGLVEVAFSPSSQFMATVSHDCRVHIINYLNWHEEAELPHQLPFQLKGCCVFQQFKSFNSDYPHFQQIREHPICVSLLSRPLKEHKSRICWSSGGRYMATCISQAPAVVWIWKLESSFSLVCVIAFENPIEEFSWDPVHNVIAIVCGDDCVTLWNPVDMKEPECLPVCVPIPSIPYQASHLSWCYDGKTLAVSSEQNSTIVELGLNE